MSATWKTVRVFISSTFRDMQAERDHLVRFVFPKLRQELLQRRIHLVDVDLRWGLTSEQDALSVCREVVDECRPRFLCMLGGRYGWVPPGKTRSITADEVRYGVLDRDLKSRGFAYFYFRDPSATAAMVEVAPGEFCEPAGRHGAVSLAELKTAITEVGLQPLIYRAQWDDQSRRLIGLKEFGDRVYADLKQSIEQEFGPTTGEKPDEFTEENAAMDAFIEERVQRFVLGSRQPVWNELRQHAESTGGNGCLCLMGAAGSGKSALLGKFCKDYRAAHPQDLVIPHFVGASPGSTDVRRTLRRLCHELVTGAGLTAEIPEDPEKLRVAFAEILQQAAAQRRVVILLDAINQFDDTTQFAGWSWLPEELPATARIIISVISDQSSVVRRRRNPPKEIELKSLTAEDAEAIIREFLSRYRKSMTDDQRAELLAKADAGTPLYLLVALEELRTLGSYEEITDRIAQMPPDTRALFIWILKRLEDDEGFRDASGRKIGRELVTQLVSLLGVSRHGLSQQELVELLSSGDPQGNVAALAQLLRPYLMQRGELLDFYHGQFREAAATAYLPSKSQRHAAHDQLATYFRGQADPERNQSWNGESARPFLELPFHLARANADELTRILLTFNWLQAKTDKALVQELIRDYDEALSVLSPNNPQLRALELVQNCLRLSAHVIVRDNRSLACQLIGRLTGVGEAEIKELLHAARSWRGSLWFLPLNPNFQTPDTGLIRTVFGIRGRVTALAISADGRRALSASEEVGASQSRETTLQLWDLESGGETAIFACPSLKIYAAHLSPDGGRALLASDDGFIRLWHTESSAQPQTMGRHSRAAFKLAVTPDWRRAVSASWDSTIKVWDLETGHELRSLLGHTGVVSSVAVTPNGRRILSASWDDQGRLKVWDADTGKELRELTGFHGSVREVATSKDGTRAYAFLVNTPDRQDIEEDGRRPVLVWREQTVKTWDLETGKELQTMCCPSGDVDEHSVAFSPDAAWAISGSGFDEHTLRFWCLAGTQRVATVRGLTDEVDGAAISAACNKAVTACWDVMHVWDLSLPLGSEPCGHNRGISALTISRDGRYAVSAAEDLALKVWDLVTGSEVRSMAGHKDTVFALSVSPDSRLILSGSNDHTLKVWDLQSGSEIRALIGHQANVLNAVMLPDGLHAVSSGGDLRLWNFQDGRLLSATAWPHGTVTSVALSSDGNAVAFAVKKETIQVMNLDTGKVKQLPKGHADDVRGLAFNFDGTLLMSLSWDGTARVWEVETGLERQVLPVGRHWQCAMVESIARHQPMAAIWGPNLELWDIATRRILASFSGETAIWHAAAAPDGRTMVVGEASGRVHILRLVYPDDPVAISSV